MTNKKETAIIIGRFQPFHLGHADLLEKIILDMGRDTQIIIGVGVSGKGRTKLNPFTFAEVSAMIRNFLQEKGYNVSIFPIADINNPECYAQHVINTMSLDLNNENYILYSNNEYTRSCFEPWIATTCATTKFPNICATKVRNLLAQNDDSWIKLVPKETANYILNVMPGSKAVGYLCRTCVDIR